MKQLNGQTALVSGSSRGIGRAIVERLATEGASVAINYLQNKQAAQSVMNTITDAGGKAIAVKADVSIPSEIKRLFDEVQSSFGELNIVVANAGTAIIKPFIEVTEEDYDKVFNTNAKGVFFTMLEAAKRLQDNGRVIITSTGGVKMLIPGNSLYLGR